MTLDSLKHIEIKTSLYYYVYYLFSNSKFNDNYVQKIIYNKMDPKKYWMAARTTSSRHSKKGRTDTVSWYMQEVQLHVNREDSAHSSTRMWSPPQSTQAHAQHQDTPYS